MDHFVPVLKAQRSGNICVFHDDGFCLVLWDDGVDPKLTMEKLDNLDLVSEQEAPS
jgi:hypothetical protein